MQRTSSLAAFLERWQWMVVAALGLLATFIRVLPRFDLVFENLPDARGSVTSFVNFQETDAWYHVRVADNLVRHFPWRSMVDPYVGFGRVQDTATAPFYDWLLGLIAWMAGAGSPSESLVHGIAAWYPVALAVCMVVAVFLLARHTLGLRAALLATAVIATLPGHFLRVSSLGYTDHHIMESLLVTLFFFLLLRALQRPFSLWTAVVAGLTLAAYLLTFHGAALVVGIVVMWGLYDRIRSQWPRDQPELSFRPLYVAFFAALCVCLTFRNLLWMNYSIAALGLGIVAIGALEIWGRWCGKFPRPRLVFFSGLAATGLVALTAGAVLVPGLRHAARSIVPRLMPAVFGTSGGVYELQSLLFENGHFTLMPVWLQFYGAYFFALVGLAVLAESALKRADPGQTLIVFWGGTTMVLAMGQLRMTYYFAIAVALLAGYMADGLLVSGRKTAWATALCLGLLVFGPNLNAALNSDQSTGIPPEWKESLDWMRSSTSEPFGDPAFYYARYKRRDFGESYRYPASAYSVMAWWDYGYWIMELARRIPVTNPTQNNAGAAANFFLSQSEEEAIPLLDTWRTRYVVVDESLPLWPTSKELMIGDFPSFFHYATKRHRTDYLLLGTVTSPDGRQARKMFYRPAYYRSMVVRLFVYGGQAVDGRGGSVILFLSEKVNPRGEPYQEVIRSQRYESAQEALTAEAACRNDGCVLVGDDPMTSCVALEALRQFRPVFASGNAAIGFGTGGRKSVQVYEFTAP